MRTRAANRIVIGAACRPHRRRRRRGSVLVSQHTRNERILGVEHRGQQLWHLAGPLHQRNRPCVEVGLGAVSLYFLA